MPPPCESRTISRSRRRTRLRSTALPTCRDTVKPMRTGPSSARRRACTTKVPTDTRCPAAAARKSVRCLNRSMAAADMAAADLAADELRSRTEPLAALGPPGRQHSAAALGRHPGAKAVAAFAHQFARLVGPFHGIDLRQRPVRHMRCGVNLIGARLARLIRKPSRPVNVIGQAPRQPAKPLCRIVFPVTAFRAIELSRECVRPMTQELKPDICIIGAGAAGRAAASAAAAFGVPVVLIEKRTLGGGAGSVPAAALAVTAERANVIRNAAHFGLKAARFGVDFAAVKAHLRDVAGTVAPSEARQRLAGLGVRIIDGAARFLDARTVTAGEFTVAARRFVIATGSSPALPAIPGLAGTPHLTSDTVFDLADCPRHLVVIGAGSIGLELAQTFRRLGADVTVLEAATPLAGDDAECAAIVLDALEREGIKLRIGVAIAQVRRVLARVEIDITTPDGAETVTGSHILVAVGRRPNVEDLDLDAAGIRYEPNGIDVDRRLRTTNKRVYAIGDVTVGPKSTHLATYHAELVVRHALFRQQVGVDHHIIPTVTHTDPELAQVGFLEDEARAHAGAIRVLRSPYRENARALVTEATAGHIKVITDRKGDILGATIVGAGAGEMIATWTLAIKQKLNIRAFAGLIVPYPAYGEVGKRAAMTYFMRGLTSNQVRRIIGWLRRLG